MLDPNQVSRAWRRKQDADLGPSPVHRWSGWPGAWCLDCGVADPDETCLATHDGFGFDPGWEGYRPCPDHQRTACPEPYSRRHDPYRGDQP